MFWIDSVAICIILLFIAIGFFGWLLLLKRIFLASSLALLVAIITTFIFTRINEIAGFGINSNDSTVLRYVDKYIINVFEPP